METLSLGGPAAMPIFSLAKLSICSSSPIKTSIMASLVYSHVALNCVDPIATERFYTKHFGFKRARVIPLGAEQIVFLKDDGSVYLELFQAKGESPEAELTND